jgi:hypothetical protein
VRSIIREIIVTRSAREAWLLARVLVFALALPISLRRHDLASLAARLEPRRPRGPVSADAIQKIVRYADAVCASRLIRGECLVRGLTRYYFLRRAGLSLALVFGMGNIEGRLVGHCWLVRDGRPFFEPIDPEPRYEPILTFSQGKARSAV